MNNENRAGRGRTHHVARHIAEGVLWTAFTFAGVGVGTHLVLDGAARNQGLYSAAEEEATLIFEDPVLLEAKYPNKPPILNSKANIADDILRQKNRDQQQRDAWEGVAGSVIFVGSLLVPIFVALQSLGEEEEDPNEEKPPAKIPLFDGYITIASNSHIR